MEDYMSLWRDVEKTDPKHTKTANVRGNNITAIAPQYQIKNATSKFGPYGSGWGFKCIDLDYSLVESTGIVVFKGVFFFGDKSFPIISSISAFKDGARKKPDHDFAKKVETDALTKALSKLGFNADVFMGLYDDHKYVSDMMEEFKEVDPIVDEIINAANSNDKQYVVNNWGGKISQKWAALPVDTVNKLNILITEK